MTDEMFMRRCLQLAAQGRMESRPNPMVGAVIVAPDAHVDTGRIIGEGYHVRCGEGHAEVNAFASVRQSDQHLLSESTIYVSLEPCAHYGKTPPCADLIVSKGVRRVVVGCVDPFARVQGRGIQRIREAGIEVDVGVLSMECEWLNRRFFTFHRHRRTYIILKWAQTANGFLDDHGRAVALSTPFTRMLVHKLRAEEDAILVGRVTFEREHPQLTVRDWHGPSPVRFVMGHGGGLPGGSDDGFLRVDSIESLLQMCCERQLQSLIVEGGARTHQTFLDASLWDEIRVETSPLCVNDGTRAPQVPASARLLGSQSYDGNRIERFVQA